MRGESHKQLEITLCKTTCIISQEENHSLKCFLPAPGSLLIPLKQSQREWPKENVGLRLDVFYNSNHEQCSSPAFQARGMSTEVCNGFSVEQPEPINCPIRKQPVAHQACVCAPVQNPLLKAHCYREWSGKPWPNLEYCLGNVTLI